MALTATSRLVFRTGPRQGAVLSVRGKGVRIGREPGNDVVLEDAGLSRRHCCFYHQGANTYVMDLDSTNGTRVNGETVLIRRPLKDGDVVQVGVTEIQFRESD